MNRKRKEERFLGAEAVWPQYIQVPRQGIILSPMADPIFGSAFLHTKLFRLSKIG